MCLKLCLIKCENKTHVTSIVHWSRDIVDHVIFQSRDKRRKKSATALHEEKERNCFGLLLLFYGEKIYFFLLK